MRQRQNVNKSCNISASDLFSKSGKLQKKYVIHTSEVRTGKTNLQRKYIGVKLI